MAKKNNLQEEAIGMALKGREILSAENQWRQVSTAEEPLPETKKIRNQIAGFPKVKYRIHPI